MLQLFSFPFSAMASACAVHLYGDDQIGGETVAEAAMAVWPRPQAFLCGRKRRMRRRHVLGYGRFKFGPRPYYLNQSTPQCRSAPSVSKHGIQARILRDRRLESKVCPGETGLAAPDGSARSCTIRSFIVLTKSCFDTLPVPFGSSEFQIALVPCAVNTAGGLRV